MYDHLTDKELAHKLSEAKGMDINLCLFAVNSKDSDLGRAYVIGRLESHDRFNNLMDRLAHHRAELRKCR